MDDNATYFQIRRNDGKFYGIDEETSTVWMNTAEGALNYCEKSDAEAAASALIDAGEMVEVVES